MRTFGTVFYNKYFPDWNFGSLYGTSQVTDSNGLVFTAVASDLHGFLAFEKNANFSPS